MFQSQANRDESEVLAGQAGDAKLHFVHVYHVTRTKFGVLATNHQEAIKAAEHEFETLPGGQTRDSDTPGYLGSEDACEVLSFMVDEAGDEEFERSASYEADGTTPSRTSIAASPSPQRFVFAAARDGDMLLETIEAASIDQAEVDAIALAHDHFGLKCPLDETESELDGFAVIEAGRI